MISAVGRSDLYREVGVEAEILYEDKHIMVVYKPAGLATQTARVGLPDLVSELKNHLARSRTSSGSGCGRDVPYLGVVHRLDQPVEGMLVFALHKKAAAVLSGQLQKQGDKGTLHKHYYAVFCGQPPAWEGKLTDYIDKDGENRAVIREPSQGRGEPAGAKKAVLQYRVLRTLDKEGRRISLADILLETGRFHQIRAQMAHGGMSLLGDMKYGDGEAREASLALGIRSVALCAYSLEFTHPVTGEALCFRTAPRGRAFSYFQGL